MEEEELEVVWTGDMPLLPPREQRPHFTYVEPKRKYTFKKDKQAPASAEADADEEYEDD